jgi:bis(5'-adenosyl)-triphosphatase
MTEHSNHCPFCRESQLSSAFMESDNFLAIYNIAPILRGHSLVIPRKHIFSLFELTDTLLAEFSLFAKDVTELLLEAFKGEGFDWSIQEGYVAGQSIPHLHLHIVIRKPKDMEGEEEWYVKIKENEALYLDDNQRPRLSDEEYRFYTEYLRNEFAMFKSRKSDKK